MGSFIGLWKIVLLVVSWISERTTRKKKLYFSCLDIHQPTLKSFVGMIKKESAGYLLPVNKQKGFLQFSPTHGSFQVEPRIEIL